VSQAISRTEGSGVLIVTLDRPAARNAIDEELSLGLAGALEDLDARDDLRSAVVTGAAGSFCAGMDLKVWQGRPREESAQALNRLVRRTTVKPVIAAVEGSAVGGGLELLASFDLVVAARDARFGLPEVRWSLVPAGGALVRLPDQLPRAVVTEMALTGGLVGAERMYELGWLARLCEPGGALDEALALAAMIAANGPNAVTAIKRVLAAPGDRWAAQDEAVAVVNDSADAAEGVRAFLQKRPPRWAAG
jgi:enoyl-CoA hydratase